MTVLEAQMQVEYGLFLLKKYLEELKAKKFSNKCCNRQDLWT